MLLVVLSIVSTGFWCVVGGSADGASSRDTVWREWRHIHQRYVWVDSALRAVDVGAKVLQMRHAVVAAMAMSRSPCLRIDQIGMHRIVNPSHSHNAVSLHIYSPPYSVSRRIIAAIVAAHSCCRNASASTSGLVNQGRLVPSRSTARVASSSKTVGRVALAPTAITVDDCSS